MSAKASIRIVIADDLALMRAGLRAFLTAYPDINLVGEASDGEEAIQLCELLKPDVVLMDLKMPIMDGVDATRAVLQRWPEIKILALTNMRDKALIQSALEAGATDYLSKDITADELAEGIRRVHKGRRKALSTGKRSAAQARLLETLGQAAGLAAADMTRLAGLLRQQLPRLFPGCHIDVRIFPDQHLLCYPADKGEHLPEGAWRWLRTRSEALLLSSADQIPWGEPPSWDGELILAPLRTPASHQTLGGVSILQISAGIRWQDDCLLCKTFPGASPLSSARPAAR